MNLQQNITQRIHELQPEMQQELFDFMEFLIHKQKTRHKKIQKNKLQDFLNSDFIGCFTATPDLSTEYKAEFAKILDKKYGYR